MNRRPLPKIIVGAGAAVLLATSVGGYLNRDTGDGEPGGSAAAPATADPGSIAIAGFRFAPATATVPVGTAVTWTNDDDFVHNVTSDGEGPLDSGDIAGGATYEMTFEEAGSFAFTCTLHPNMTGVVEVTG